MDAIANENLRDSSIAGFWRRIAAALIDYLILGVLGVLLGLLFFERLAALGSPGRFIGAAIALVYFGVLNSQIGRGQSLGKRIVGIRVVDADGKAIGLARSLLREIVLLAPFTLNGIELGHSDPLSSASYPAWLIVFGGIISIAYLYLFNRQTRQSLHDLAVGTFVVREGETGEIHARIWKPHLAVPFVVLVALAVASGPFTEWIAGSEIYEDLSDIRDVARSVVPGSEVLVSKGIRSTSTTNGGSSSSTYLIINVRCSVEPPSYEDTAARVAEAVFRSEPTSRKMSNVAVSISYGYDIMIASFHTTQNFSHSPEDWETFIQKRSLTTSPAL